HTKFAILLAVFAAALVFRLRRQVRAIVAVCAPIAISLAAWAWFFYLLYGTFDPQAPYGDYMLEVQPKNIPRSLLGLLFDQKFGLLVYSPIYLAAIAGCWTMLRRAEQRLLAVTLLTT